MMPFISSIVTQVPTITDIRPSMEVLDDDHVLVDYSNSFNIPDFSKIITVSVLNYVSGLNYGIATREDYNNGPCKYEALSGLQYPSVLYV